MHNVLLRHVNDGAYSKTKVECLQRGGDGSCGAVAHPCRPSATDGSKVRNNNSRILQPSSNYQQETAPFRVYGNYTPPGRGHPSGPAVDMSELEDHIIMNVAGVYIAFHLGLLHPCCTVCVVFNAICETV